MKTNKLLIIGGGFAGYWSAISAFRQSRTLEKESELEITVVNLDGYLTMRPRLYEVSLDGLRVDLNKYFAPLGVNLVIGKAEIIDPQNQIVTVATDHGIRKFDYDYLILASGSALKGVEIPGIQHSFNVDTFSNAQKLEDHLIKLAKNNFSADGASTFIVVGSGLTGLEVATSIKEKAELIQKQYATENANFKVVLIDRNKEIAGYYAADAQAYVLEILAAKDIEIRPGAFVKSMEPEVAVLNSGDKIASHTVIFSTGIVASPLTAFFNAHKDELGRLQVDQYLKLPGHDNVIIAGDVATLPIDEAGNLSLMACQFSMDLGKFAGHNAVNDLFALPLQTYQYNSYVTCVDLGQDEALFTSGFERNLVMKDKPAKDLKMEITTKMIYPSDDLEETIANSFPKFLAGSTEAIVN
jgi:NADH:ubiquinone reductase (H+-translocating)